MNPTIMAALVAGLVSLIGLLVNLYMARKSRSSAEGSDARRAIVDMQNEAADALRCAIIETERLRISSWELLGWLYPYTTGKPSLDWREHEADSRKDDRWWRMFKPVASSFRVQAEAFAWAWPPVKANMAEGLLRVLRKSLHDCRNNIAGVHEALRMLESLRDPEPGDKPFTPEEAANIEEQLIGHLNNSIPNLLETADRFISLLSDVRQSVLGRVGERTCAYRDRDVPHHAAYGSVLRGSADQAESDPGKHKSE